MELDTRGVGDGVDAQRDQQATHEQLGRTESVSGMVGGSRPWLPREPDDADGYSPLVTKRPSLAVFTLPPAENISVSE
jgi:hypothetical protein